MQDTRCGITLFQECVSDSVQGQRPQSVFSGSVQSSAISCRDCEQRSLCRVQHPPSHGTDLIEALHRLTGINPADRPGVSEEFQVAVDLFRRGVGDSPVIQPVSTESAVPFCQVRRDRTWRPDYLIGYGFQRSWNPHHELDRDSCCFEGFRVGNEVGGRGGFGHGHLRVVHAQTHKPVWRSMSRMPCTLPVLDIGRPPATPSFERPGGGHFVACTPDRWPLFPDAVP